MKRNKLVNTVKVIITVTTRVTPYVSQLRKRLSATTTTESTQPANLFERNVILKIYHRSTEDHIHKLDLSSHEAKVAK